MDNESEKHRIHLFVEKGNYHAAINLAISTVNECRRNNDQAGVDIFLDISKRVIHKMTEEFVSQ
ncbi:MAG: hypothetical protein ACMUJM_18585 [bacterium]